MMLVRSYPDFFGTYKIYEIIESVLEKNMRKRDIELLLNDLEIMDAKPSNFLRTMARALKKHVSASKASSIVMQIRQALIKQINMIIEPEEIVIQKEGGKAVLKVTVENNFDEPLKFRVGVKQVDHQNSTVIYNPVKNYGVNQLIKAAIINPGKVHVFKFPIKVDILEIEDLYTLRKNGELNITLGVQAGIEGIDGTNTNIKKVKLKILA